MTILTMAAGVGLREGFNGMPSVLCLLEFKTLLETLKVTSPDRSRLTLVESKWLILKEFNSNRVSFLINLEFSYRNGTGEKICTQKIIKYF